MSASSRSSRPLATPAAPSSEPGAARRSDWATIAKLLPYLWHYRWRVGLALGFMLCRIYLAAVTK